MHETDFTYLEMKCTCVNVALASKSDSCLREFLSREELFMLDTRCQEARQIQAQNAANRAAQDTENEMAQKQYESSLKQRAEQREEDYKLLIAAVEKKKREFIQECEARFHMEFTEPAKSRNHSRLLRACWKYYSEFFPSPSTIIEAGTAADDLMRNSQILKDELERQTVSNHDITACPYCRRAALNPKSLTLAIEEVLDQVEVPIIVCPIKFKSMQSEDFTDKFRFALKSSLSVVASVRRKTMKEVEFSSEFKGPLPDTGVTTSDIIFGDIIELIPSIYAQKQLGLVPSLEIPVSIYVDKLVAQECLKRVTEAIEWGRLKTLMQSSGFEIKIDFEKRPSLLYTNKFQRFPISAEQAELLKNYQFNWNKYLERFHAEWVVPKLAWETLQERFRNAAEIENSKRLEAKRCLALKQFEEEIELIQNRNNFKVKRLEKQLRKKQVKDRAAKIHHLYDQHEKEKANAQDKYRQAYAQAMKHNARVEFELQKLKAEATFISQQKALALKVSIPTKKERLEERKKGLYLRSQECFQLAYDLTKRYNVQATELNQIETTQAMNNFERHCRQREAENEEIIAIERELWEERQKDAESKNAAALDEYKIQCQKTVEHNLEVGRKYQERLESIRRYNDTRQQEATAKWEKDASAVERKNRSLIERLKNRWTMTVRRIERKNDMALKEARIRYAAAFDAMIRHNNRVRSHHEFGQLAASEMLTCRRFLDVLFKYGTDDDSLWEREESALVILHSSAASQASQRFAWWSEAGWTEKGAATNFILKEGICVSEEHVDSSKKTGQVEKDAQKFPNIKEAGSNLENRNAHHDQSSRVRRYQYNSMVNILDAAESEERCREAYWSMFAAQVPHRPHTARSTEAEKQRSRPEGLSRPLVPRPPQGPRDRPVRKQMGRKHSSHPAFGSDLPRLSLWGVPSSTAAIPPLMERVAMGARLEQAEILRSDTAEHEQATAWQGILVEGSAPAGPSGRPASVRRERQAIPTLVVAEALAAAYRLDPSWRTGFDAAARDGTADTTPDRQGAPSSASSCGILPVLAAAP